MMSGWRRHWPALAENYRMAMWLAVICVCACELSYAQDSPGSNLFLDFSNIGQIHCGEFYDIPIVQQYFLSSDSQPGYRIYGDLLIFTPCRTPILSDPDFPVETVQTINCLRKCQNACGCAIGAIKPAFSLTTILSSARPTARLGSSSSVMRGYLQSANSSFKTYRVLVRSLRNSSDPVDKAMVTKYPEYSDIYTVPFRPKGDRNTKYLFLLGLRSTGDRAGTLDLIIDPLADVVDCPDLKDIIESQGIPPKEK